MNLQILADVYVSIDSKSKNFTDSHSKITFSVGHDRWWASKDKQKSDYFNIEVPVKKDSKDEEYLLSTLKKGAIVTVSGEHLKNVFQDGDKMATYDFIDVPRTNLTIIRRVSSKGESKDKF